MTETINFNIKNEFEKQPSEQYPIAIDFEDRLPSGLSLISGQISAMDLYSGVDKSSEVLQSGIAVISGTLAIISIKAGANGNSYKISLQATLSDGSILEEDLIMKVLEK
jgi:hypothetical protein